MKNTRHSSWPKFKLATRELFLIAALFCSSHAYSAGGAKLFGLSDIVSKDRELGLKPKEASHLAKLRARNDHLQDVTVTSISQAALLSNVINLTLPDGKVYEYTGTRTLNERDGTYLWKGNSSTGSASISSDEQSLYGQFNEGGKIYTLMNLAGGKLYVLMRSVPLPNGIQDAELEPPASAVPTVKK